jgi:GT2 family glycosyltransferase
MTSSSTHRPRIHGRSVLHGGEKLHVRGVTYGTFGSADRSSLPSIDQVRRDFEAMAAAGVNAVRTYTPPATAVLDAASEMGLHVMVGLAWEQHVAFLDDPRRARRIVERVGRQVQECEAHPAVLCYAIGNEIPASICRWHGKRQIERFLERLYWEAKANDPGGLFTYVNYPSTENLELPFLDVVAVNVFQEDEATFESYLARLHNLSGERPLLVTEAGLDSRRNGADAQARALDWQVRHAFATGAAGLFVFSWTDEWHRGGHEVTDWDFGLVDRQRRPKPALEVVGRAFAGSPFHPDGPWPKISVVVCTHNGEATLAQCLDRAAELTYPDFEVVVVDDGSTDGSADVARARGVTLVQTEHRGLSFARNAGVQRAAGAIVAFLDDDAYPDPDWLHYVAASLRANDHAGMGGPNIPPENDGLIADCVAAAPGGPIHVLISDREAEHVPGCNMAFRKSALQEIGGFDERFRVAGDDVDVCWRLQEAGHTLGFSAGAVVMHRRRDSVRRYLKQQYGYGKAEALLERKWPERYNDVGHVRWGGRVYGGLLPTSRRRRRVAYGTWGSNAFQSVYDAPYGTLGLLPQTPEWYLLLALLSVLSVASIVWTPLAPAVLLLAAAAAPVLYAAGWATLRADMRGERRRLRLRAMTFALHLLQPAVRLRGRLSHGLTPWRSRAQRNALARPRTALVWSETWRAPEEWLASVETALFERGVPVVRGGDFDRHDLRVRGGLFTGAHVQMAVEEHGAGRQLLRFRVTPRLGIAVPAFVVGAVIAAVVVSVTSSHLAIGLIAVAVALTALAAHRSAGAMAAVLHVIEHESADALEAVEEPSADAAVPATAEGSLHS